MSPIVPAIIPKSFDDLRHSLERVAPFAREVQIDIVDGKFVPFTSWPGSDGDTISDIKEFSHQFLIEVDLMVVEPERVIEEYLRAGIRRIVVHVESTTHLNDIIAFKKQYDFKIGFSINNDTPLSTLTGIIEHADYVQFMGIAHIGSQGQPFDERVLERIETLKHTHPTLIISIDGSVNTDTVSRLAHAGADRCVSGSAILKAENPQRAYDELVSLFAIGTQ